MLRIGTEWITSKYKQAIHDAHYSAPLREYCCKRFDWSDNTFDLVQWDTGKGTTEVNTNKENSDNKSDERAAPNYAHAAVYNRSQAVSGMHVLQRDDDALVPIPSSDDEGNR